MQGGRAVCCSAFGRLSVNTVWNNVRCTGVEPRLAECSHYESRYVSCFSRDYASVLCFTNETFAGERRGFQSRAYLVRRPNPKRGLTDCGSVLES